MQIPILILVFLKLIGIHSYNANSRFSTDDMANILPDEISNC